MTRAAIAGILFPAVLGISAHADDEPAAAPARRLFNGLDLTGWTTWLRGSGHEDPRGVFSVRDGMLRISGDGFGYLATDDVFEEFSLIVEWRWGGNIHPSREGMARDSGIFVAATGPHGNSHDGDGAYMAAVEVNVFEGATGDLLLIRGDDADGNLIEPRVIAKMSEAVDADGWSWWDPNGEARTIRRWGRVNWRDKARSWSDKLGFRGEQDIEKLPGQWNRLEISHADDALEVRLNGILVNRAEQIFPAAGRILLQCEGAEIVFRRIEIRGIEARGEIR